MTRLPKLRCWWIAPLLWSLSCVGLSADDWPTLKNDERRSAVSTEQLDFIRLHQAWKFTADQPPAPAWPGPARWDAYVKRSLISSMRNYDESFHVTASDGLIFFGSSADDSVHCLDAHTGRELWRYTVGGPVRLPPTISRGRAYFGSDDGTIYCLSIATQQLVWKFKPSPPRQLLNDGRLISQWPIRTAILIKDQIVYAGASLLPWEKSYLCALDVETGTPHGTGKYVRELDGATLEGSILADQDQLLVTQGRAAPLWLTRSTGKSRGLVPGVHGGTFALIAADGSRFFGPGPREGFLSETNASHSTSFARKYGAIALVAHEGKLYDLERRTLGCMRQKPEEWLWRRPSDLEESLIVAGDTLVAGGDRKIVAFRCADGEPVWQAEVDGRAQGLAVADGCLLVSTDEGSIYCFRSDATANASETEVKPYQVSAPKSYEPILTVRPPANVRRGPLLRFTGPQSASLSWETTEPTQATVVYGVAGFDHLIREPEISLRREVELTGLRKNTVYQYALVIDDQDEGQVVGPYECDTHMNALRPVPLHQPENAAGLQRASALAKELVASCGRTSGICLLMGAEHVPLASAIAAHTRMNVIVVETDDARVSQARAELLPSATYGTQIAVCQAETLSELNTPDSFVNLLVVSPETLAKGKQGLAAELSRVLCPDSGRWFVVGQNNAAAASVLNSLEKWLPSHKCTLWHRGVQIIKPAPAGTGIWTHQYGRADNATYADETLAGACQTTDFEVQWLGRPGPRFQSDRGNRKPAPLYAQGRLYAQGLDRVMAVDALNGTQLWGLEIPDSRRFNIRNDSANWCADDEHLYLAVRDACWAINGTTGELDHEYTLPALPGKGDWGYVGRQGQRLIGSRVPVQSGYKEFWGGQYWYTNSEGPLAAKVCSDLLFACNPTDGTHAWQYQGGRIVNTSIALTDDLVVFVESRHPDVLKSSDVRFFQPQLWADLHLVALSLTDGQLRWRRKIDMGPATTMFSLACSKDYVVALSSVKGNYRLLVVKQHDGELVWETAFPWEADGKGGDSARPAIIGDTLYVSPRAFTLATGKALPQKLTRGACGSYAAAQGVFITRLGNLGLWDPQQNVATTWDRLRPDCWLSAIPAGGLILAPEGGGGCSCGGWIETSIAFAPRRKELRTPPADRGKSSPAAPSISD